MPRGPSLRDRLDKATLEKLYNEAGLSTVTIAQRYGSHTQAALKLMEEYGIPRRSRGAGKT
jgi:transcriptional regulator of aromatic amino acid metabolism